MVSIEQQRLNKWIKVLHGKDAEMSRIAAEKLGDMGNSVAIPELIDVMHNRTMIVASTAAKALGNIGDRSAVKDLMKVLEDPKHDVVIRTAAAESLGKIRHYSAIPALEAVTIEYEQKYKNDRYNLIQGYERGLFTTAIRALKQIDTPKARRIAAKAERF